MSFQSSEILFGPCGGASPNIVRLLCPIAKGHDSVKHTPAQRGKVGTHVAVPGSYSLGIFDRLKQIGLRRWAEGGPWAPRRLAAIAYVMRFDDCIPLPNRWTSPHPALPFVEPFWVLLAPYPPSHR